MRFIHYVPIACLALAGCQTGVSPEELASVNYGPKPAHWQEEIKSYMAIRVPDASTLQLDFKTPPQQMVQKETAVRDRQWGWATCVWVDENHPRGYQGRYPMTFFFREMPQLIEGGHLYLAQPPLYAITQGARKVYARDDAHKDDLLKNEFAGRKVEISRFKGLGEMPWKDLKQTTMDPANRVLLRVRMPHRYVEEERDEARETSDLVERLMGRKPELRFQYIQENAQFARDLDV